MLRGRRIMLALALGAALCCCDTQYSHATPQASQELAQLMQEIQEAPFDSRAESIFPDWDAVVEFTKLYERFQDADDTRLTTPGGVSILHAACFFKKPELARCLLADGADPNAATEAGLTPLALAVGRGGPDDSDEEAALQLIEVLHRAGARPEPGAMVQAAQAASDNMPRERVFAALLDMGCPPSDESVFLTVLNGWHTLLLRQGEYVKTLPQETVDEFITVATACYEGDCTPIIQTLVEWKPNVSRAALDTALRNTANAAWLSPDAETLAYALRTSETLLRLGANPNVEEEEEPSAADIICAVPAWADALRRAGYAIQPNPSVFTEGEELHHQVVRADMLQRALPAGDPDLFSRVAALVTETHEDQDCCCEHNIHSSALGLLLRTDPQKTAEIITALPIWQDLDAWEKHGGTSLLPAMIEVAQGENSQLALPPQKVCRIAQEMNSRGMQEEACTLLSLLSATPTQEAADTLQRYAGDATHPALQAGAICALVRRAHLPQPEEGAVEEWMEKHPDTATHPAVQTAGLLTSTARLWGGQMSPVQRQSLLQAMRDIGAAEAAEKHEAIIKHLNNPDALDELESGDQSWKFRFKARIGEFILQHGEEF